MNESLTITQIVEINGKGYLFLVPFGAQYTDVFEALSQLHKDNKEKQASVIEAEEKKKLELEMKNSLTEAAM